MAPPGLLFLLFLLSSPSLLRSTVSISLTSTRTQEEAVTLEKVNKHMERAKALGNFIRNNIDMLRFAVIPFLSLIPFSGPLIAAITTLALVSASVVNNKFKDDPIMNALKDEFESLNLKLDNYHVEQKWDSWASGAYHKPELKIEVAWKRYEALLPSLLQSTAGTERENIKKQMIEICSKSEKDIYNLNRYLTAGGTTFISNLGEALIKKVQCHEKDIREYTSFISILMIKGNTMNELCYSLKQIKSDDLTKTEAQITYDSAAAMFHIHKHCIVNSTQYIRSDVLNLITDTMKRQQLAEKVRLFLQETYERYDWLVVAFTTRPSQHKAFKSMNRRTVSGFIEVQKGKVTVAVARQVKGSHDKTAAIKEAIKKCLPEKTQCHKVEQTLSQCKESGEGVQVSKAYTAVHAYRGKANDGNKEDVVPDPENVVADPEDASYIYTGKCMKSPLVKGGTFVVMIKSDVEMANEDPCATLDCGGEQRGSCVRAEDTFVALCECKKLFYGQNCDQTLDEYLELVKGKILPAIEDSKHQPLAGATGGLTVKDNRNPHIIKVGPRPGGRPTITIVHA